MKFRSADQAVRFAFRMRGRAEYARSNPASEGVRGHAISPMDLHGESAMILSKIDGLPRVERSSVMAMYGDRGERAEAMVVLGDYIMPLVANGVPDRLFLQIMLMHLIYRTPSIRTMAKDSSVSYRQVCKWRSSVAAAWAPLHARAMDRLEQALFAPGGHDRGETD